MRILEQKGDPFWAQSLTKLHFFELEQVGAGRHLCPNHRMHLRNGCLCLSVADLHALPRESHLDNDLP